MSIRPNIAAATAALVLAAGIVSEASIPQSELMEVLNRLGIPVDTNAFARPLAEALIKTVDPRGEILTAEEALRFDEGRTVEAAESWPEGLFYLKFAGMHADGATSLEARVTASLQHPPTGLILDLRNAGGYSTETADALLSMFFDPGTVLYGTRGATGGTVTQVVARKTGVRFAGVSCALLVNEETRGVCEAVAAVLRATPDAVLIGWPTRGDAGIRSPIELSDGNRLLVASRWIVPTNGVEYHGKGLAPDISPASSSLPAAQVPTPIPGFSRTPSDRALASARLRERIGGDAALERACDLLVGLKAMRKTTNAWVPEQAPRKKVP